MKKKDLKITCKYSWEDKQWDKEFEDELVDSYEFGLDLKEEDLLNLVEKYLDKNFSNPDNPNMKQVKVKIKCKDGCIQIERIK